MAEKFNPEGICHLITEICDNMKRQVFIAGIEDFDQAYETAKIRILEENKSLEYEIKIALEKLETFIDFTKCVKR